MASPILPCAHLLPLAAINSVRTTTVPAALVSFLPFRSTSGSRSQVVSLRLPLLYDILLSLLFLFLVSMPVQCSSRYARLYNRTRWFSLFSLHSPSSRPHSIVCANDGLIIQTSTACRFPRSLLHFSPSSSWWRRQRKMASSLSPVSF